MPTPVSVARQCLTPDSAHALDEAVAVARRRGHAQTTSLHAVSALLALPSSALRDACTRPRGGSPYSPRLQFKALELCLSVSLDRVPSGQLTDDPPVSNSLMAAIKRSQANQRRQPENFHLYQQLANQSSSINNTIKVELQHLILSILDDPVVSRVFGEAGFRSSEIKLAIVRPFPHLFRYSRPRGPPMFLCNPNQDPGPGCVRFPFSVFPGFSDLDSNNRRIGEILGRSKGMNNPLLVGGCADIALKGFIQTLSLLDGESSPELFGFRVIDMESYDGSSAYDKLEEQVGKKMVESQRLVMVVVVSIGDLESFTDGDNDGGAEGVVTRLTNLLGNHGGKMRLIGSVGSYDTYLKFVNKYPSVEEWEFQLLPITTLQAAAAAAASNSMSPESYPRSRLMESFVPFGGLFSSPAEADLNGRAMMSTPLPFPLPPPPSRQHHQCSTSSSISQALVGSDAAAQGIIMVPKGDAAAPHTNTTTSVADRCQYSLPSWMQMSELGEDGLMAKAKDDRVVLSADKCDDIHQNQPISEPPSIHRIVVKTIVGFLPSSDNKKSSDNMDTTETDASRCRSAANSCLSMMHESPKISISMSQVSPTPRKQSFLPKLWQQNPSIRTDDVDSISNCCGSNLSADDACHRASPASATSVTTSSSNLGLRISSAPDITILKKQPLSNSCPNISDQFLGGADFKRIYGALVKKVGRQHEAISLVSQTLACLRRRSDNRGDLWLSFLGPDRIGKRKVAVSLSEVLYGSRDNLIDVDLFSSDESSYRRKTAVDVIAAELSKKPMAVVFLENVDKADEQVQTSLFQAIWTGKFSDSFGREVNVNHAIFVTTSSFTKLGGPPKEEEEAAKYSEDRILAAKRRWPVKILVEDTIPLQPHMNKRKLVESNGEDMKRAYKTPIRTLDLNLPAEMEELQQDNKNDDVMMMSESSKAWLLDFFDHTDAAIVFRPYDFESLAEKILKDIRLRFHQTAGIECSVEVDTEVMEQLLSAVYKTDSYKVVEDWIAEEFSQVQSQYNSCKLTEISTVRLTVCQ